MSKILKLDKIIIRNAFGLAYSQASGNRQALLDGSISKRIQPGFAAMQGINSVYLAKNGISGAQNIFSGKFSLPVLFSRGIIDYDIFPSLLYLFFQIQ